MFDYFRNFSSNAHHVCCEDSPIKGLYNRCQSDDLDLHSRSQLRLKLDSVLTCSWIVRSRTNIYSIAFKLGVTVHIHAHFDDLALTLTTLTLMQGHSGLAVEIIQRWTIITTKQAIRMLGLNSVSHDLDFENIYILFYFFLLYFVFFVRFFSFMFVLMLMHMHMLMFVRDAYILSFNFSKHYHVTKMTTFFSFFFSFIEQSNMVSYGFDTRLIWCTSLQRVVSHFKSVTSLR